MENRIVCFSLEETEDLRAMQLELDLSNEGSFDMLKIFEIQEGNNTNFHNVNEHVIPMHIEFIKEPDYQIYNASKDFNSNYINQILIVKGYKIDSWEASQKYAFVHYWDNETRPLVKVISDVYSIVNNFN